MNKLIASHEFQKQLCTALGLEAKLIRRIVLDVNIHSAVVVYVEMYADEKMLKISQTLEGVEIEVVNVSDMKT